MRLINIWLLSQKVKGSVTIIDAKVGRKNAMDKIHFMYHDENGKLVTKIVNRAATVKLFPELSTGDDGGRPTIKKWMLRKQIHVPVESYIITYHGMDFIKKHLRKSIESLNTPILWN
jgi:hypothetical protein